MPPWRRRRFRITRRSSASFSRGGMMPITSLSPSAATEYQNYASIRSPVLAVPQAAALPSFPRQQRRAPVRPPPELRRAADALRRGQAGPAFQCGHPSLPDHARPILLARDRPAAPALFPRGPIGPMADLHPGPAAEHRLGRALRGSPGLRAACGADLPLGHPGRRQYLRSRKFRFAVFGLHQRRGALSGRYGRPAQRAFSKSSASTRRRPTCSGRPTRMWSSRPSTPARF